MGGQAQAAEWLRNYLSQLPWLGPAGPLIDRLPDWLLLATGPVALVIFALLLGWAWPKKRKRASKISHQGSAEQARVPHPVLKPPTPAEPNDPDTLTSMNNLAQTLYARGYLV
jgi:hypothetical protein